MMRRFAPHLVFLLALGPQACRTENSPPTASNTIVVGAKNFRESEILAELIAQQLERWELPVRRDTVRRGTFASHRAIVAGDLDVYVEYSGTAFAAILPRTTHDAHRVNLCGTPGIHSEWPDSARMHAVLDSVYAARWNLVWTKPLGFSNPFAMLIRRELQARRGVTTLSEAVQRGLIEDWRPAFGYEFAGRPDTYMRLEEGYGFHFRFMPTVMPLDLTYEAVHKGRADIIAGNATDGQILALGLFHLEDDLHVFPPYAAVPVVRHMALDRHPCLRMALDELGGILPGARAMMSLNHSVESGGPGVAAAVRELLKRRLPQPTPSRVQCEVALRVGRGALG